MPPSLEHLAFDVCQVLHSLPGGFRPRISADGGRLVVWTGHGADHLVIGADGSVVPSGEELRGCELFPPEWV